MLKWALIGSAVAVGLIVAYLGVGPGRTPPITDPRGRPLPASVAELQAVEIGGLEQWILVRGHDRSNPVLLWLHGGPGAAQIPVHRAFNKELERDFVVVHWDQRGAGKSNHAGFREETMTLARFIADVHELTRYLQVRFGQERIFLLGHSWGALLGVYVVQRYPEDYHAFVSVAQPVHARRGEEIAYAWLREQVSAHGTRAQRERFAALGSPPFLDHVRYVAFSQLREAFGGGMDVGMARLAWIALGSTEYTMGDYVRWLGGANRGSGPMWEETTDNDLFREVPALGVPVAFIVGSEDQNTPAALVREYFEALEAPQKTLHVIEGTAHAPFLGDPARFGALIVEIRDAVLPSAGPAGAATPVRGNGMRTDREAPATVREATPGEVARAARVAAEAFQGEAFTNWLFDLSPERLRAHLARTFARTVARKWEAGDSLLVAVAGGEIVGAALVHVPGQPARSPRWRRALGGIPHLGRTLSLARWIRSRRVPSTLKAMQPPKDLPKPHATLVGLAVAPDHQGTGIARLLLDSIHARVEADAHLEGIYLFTGDARNRDIYTHFGYWPVRESRAGAGFTAYHMFRACEGRAG